MRTKKVKPPPRKFEYRLNISKEYDEISKRDYISFRFQTTKEFLTFKYILKIETRVEDKNIVFNLLGFTAPIGGLSNYGTAGYEFRLYDYKHAEYTVVVDKKDSDKSKFKMALLKLRSKPIKLSAIPRKSFIEIKTDNDT